MTGINLFRIAWRPAGLCIALAGLLFLVAPAHAQYDSFAIAEYRLEQFSTSDEASIALYGVEGNQFALLIFLPVAQASNLPPAAKGNDGIIRLYYKRQRWAEVLDQLRNEAPAILNFWTGSGSNSHIATRWEPIGEGE